MFKFTRLRIKNLGPIVDTDLALDMPLVILFGEIAQGKTKHLDAVRYVCGGAFPQDIIRHGQKEAVVELDFTDGSIKREWYWSRATEGKPSEIKARPVQLIRKGRLVENPVAELKRLLNPFMLNQDYFRSMTEDARKQYLVDLVGVDTSALDTEATAAASKAKDLRAKLTGYGDIDLTEVKEVDTAALRQELATIRTMHESKVEAWKRERTAQANAHAAAIKAVEDENDIIRQGNSTFDRALQTQDASKLELARLQKAVTDLQDRMQANTRWMADHPKQPEKPLPSQPVAPELPTAPDTSEIEAKLQNAAAQNVRAESYKQNLEREKKRLADETALKALEDRQRQIKAEKIAALSKVSENSGVKGLTFDEDGTPKFEGVTVGMLSGSQMMRLSSALEALYPEGLGILLLDRGESLGRSIMDYVQHAEKTHTTVLATVVGNPPADVPEKVGVFICRDGLIFDKEASK
jgi:DNA repair ATPase RecN